MNLGIYPPAPRTTTPTTTTHHPVKHQQSKDHERQDGSGKHGKTHRRKPSGGRGHGRIHNNNFNPYEDLYEDFENGETLQVTTMISNSNANNNNLKNYYNKGDENGKTTPPPQWNSNSKNSWGGTRIRNSGISSHRHHVRLPYLLGSFQLIPLILVFINQ